MLKSDNFSATYRIYYEDTDAGGIVYYANYLKFFERARTDFLRHLGISQSEFAKKENMVFVVRKCNIAYLSPAKLDELIEVSVAVSEIRKASIVMKQVITRSNKILSRLEVEIVCVTLDQLLPMRIPAEILKSLKNV